MEIVPQWVKDSFPQFLAEARFHIAPNSVKCPDPSTSLPTFISFCFLDK